MPGVSKVTYGDEVLLDLTQDTVNPGVLLSGFTAHAANGDPIGGALVLGALAYLNSISYNSNYLTNKPTLGALAALNSIDYNSNYLINKPVFGEFAFYNKLSYLSDRLTEKPQLGDLAFLNTVNYKTQVTEKPVFGDLAFQDSISYESDQLTDKPISYAELMENLVDIYPDMPKGIKLAVSAASGGMMLDSDVLYYAEDGIHVREAYEDWFTYLPDSAEDGILVTVKEKLSDIVKPLFDELGDLAYQDDIDYNSEKLKNKPISYSELMENLVDIYPDMPKGIKLAVSAASGELLFDDEVMYYSDSGIHIHAAYEDWFTYLPDSTEDGIFVTIQETLSDITKPLFDELGNLAYQDSISYESDQLTDKPTSADEIIRSILDVYPDLPVGISSVILASSGHALYAGDSTFVYQDDGIVFNSSNMEGVTAAYDDSGILLGFSPLQFIEDAPDDGKLYARRHGAWAEINI